MDFDEIAEAQGWNEHTMLFLLREFITKIGMQEALDQFALERAYEENGETPDMDKRPGMRCFCCHGEKFVTEMTDGHSSHTVCDECRPMVTTFFHVHRSMMEAVLEVARAKRGTK